MSKRVKANTNLLLSQIESEKVSLKAEEADLTGPELKVSPLVPKRQKTGY